MTKKRIGILTGGGDCPGLNAVIRAVTKSAHYVFDMDVLGVLNGFHGMVTGASRVLGDGDVSNILVRGGTILGSSNRDNPFAFYDVPEGSPLDRSEDVLENYARWGLDALICVGGDGTLALAQRFVERGLTIVGVPKTIDNDLACTDFTFGHDSAVQNATEAIDKAHDTAQSHHRIIAIETMGRYAGWIALRAGLAGGGDVILIPEIPYHIEAVAKSIQARVSAGKTFSLVIVAEGAKAVGGELVSYRQVKGAADPIRLGGVSHQVANQLEDLLGIETRSMILGYIQRGGSPSAFDRILSTRFGYHAAELARDGLGGKMVALRGRDIVSTSIADAIGQLRLVAADSELVQAARATGVCFGD